MIGMKPVAALAAVAFALTLAPLAHAQGAATPAGGTPAKTAPAKSAAAMAPAKASSSKMAPEAKVDLNSATREELMKIPGIGDALADKIIQNRPFKTKNELVSKGLVTKANYARFAPHVIAKQPGGAAAKAK